MRTDQSQTISWRDGVPVSNLFDDPFYSLEDGWAESCHVFANGNDLPKRLCDGFHVAELGFGTGLNLALILSLWRGPGRLSYTGFEAYPLAPTAAVAALEHFPQAAPHVAAVTTLLETGFVETEIADLTLIKGDARETVKTWAGEADAWFLDGFAPARNPELWEPALLAEVARHTRKGGTFATYSAAGHVRRALACAGFDVNRAPGYGRKRHMSRGVLL